MCVSGCVREGARERKRDSGWLWVKGEEGATASAINIIHATHSTLLLLWVATAAAEVVAKQTCLELLQPQHKEL